MAESFAQREAVSFGSVLKEWRNHRRVSQLELATNSGISQRHISFLETGRSNPSRSMVLALCSSLDVPLRERNTLLSSAGFAPMYAEAGLDDQSLEFFKEMLSTVIAHHEPYPALVLDGEWNVVLANHAAVSFFSKFIDPNEVLGTSQSETSYQIVRLCLREDGIKPYVENWQELIWALLQRARRALATNPNDQKLPALIETILQHPEAPKRWREPDWRTNPDPVINMTLKLGKQRYALYTMLAHFGTAEHVTLEELTVETFYPADAATKAYFDKPKVN